MVGAARLLQLTLWVAAANAFYPWFPDNCDDCKPGSKRGVDGPGARTGNGVTLGLVQRVAPIEEDASARSARAAREAGRLATKYAQRGAPLTSRTKPKLRTRENKYSVIEPAPPTGKSTAGIYQDGTDNSYFVKVQWGSSQKPMYMLLDSGAGTSWVMGPDCKSDACLLHNNFGPKDSTTLTRINDAGFSLSYGSGSVSGWNGRDTIRVAGLETDMVIGIANETSKDFTHFPFDGILGLARGKGFSDNFMSVISTKKLVPSNLFAVSLSRSTEVTNTGTVTFGGIDASKYVGDISYTAVAADKPNNWAIPMDDMGYGPNQWAGVYKRVAYIDTGTSYAFGPAEDVAAIHRVIPGAQSSDGVTYTVPCDSDKDITVQFSKVTYTIPPKDWLSRSSNGLCTSNFYGHEVLAGSWLMGDVFLKNVYSVFDADSARIGFAKKPVAPEVTTTMSSPSTSTVLKVETTVVNGATITIAPPAPTTVPPAIGQDGGAGTAVPESQGNAASTSSSPGEQLEGNKLVSIMCIVVVAVMMA